MCNNKSNISDRNEIELEKIYEYRSRRRAP